MGSDPGQEEKTPSQPDPVLSFSFLFPEAYLNLVVFILVCLLEQEARAGMSEFPGARGEQPVFCRHPGCPPLATCAGRMEVKPQVPPGAGRGMCFYI